MPNAEPFINFLATKTGILTPFHCFFVKRRQNRQIWIRLSLLLTSCRSIRQMKGKISQVFGFHQPFCPGDLTWDLSRRWPPRNCLPQSLHLYNCLRPLRPFLTTFLDPQKKHFFKHINDNLHKDMKINSLQRFHHPECPPRRFCQLYRNCFDMAGDDNKPRFDWAGLLSGAGKSFFSV